MGLDLCYISFLVTTVVYSFPTLRCAISLASFMLNEEAKKVDGWDQLCFYAHILLWKWTLMVSNKCSTCMTILAILASLFVTRKAER